MNECMDFYYEEKRYRLTKNSMDNDFGLTAMAKITPMAAILAG